MSHRSLCKKQTVADGLCFSVSLFSASNDRSLWRDLFAKDGLDSAGVAVDERFIVVLSFTSLFCLFKERRLHEECICGHKKMRTMEWLPMREELENEACSSRIAFVRELRSVAGEAVPAKTAVFLEEMMNKEGSGQRHFELDEVAILGREFELRAREKGIFIEKLKGNMDF
nr:hypothetical protein [Tanacetum cinerariifolium]